METSVTSIETNLGILKQITMYCTEVEVSDCVNPTVLPSPTSSSYSSFSLVTSQDSISLSITGAISIATSIHSIIFKSSSLSSILSSSSPILSSLSSSSSSSVLGSSSSILSSSSFSSSSPYSFFTTSVSPSPTPTNSDQLSFLSPELTAALCIILFLFLLNTVILVFICIYCCLRHKPMTEVSITQTHDNLDYNGENITANVSYEDRLI